MFKILSGIFTNTNTRDPRGAGTNTDMWEPNGTSASTNTKSQGIEGADANTNPKSRKLKLIIITGVAVVALAGATVFAFVLFGGNESAVSQSRFSVQYTVTPSDDPNVKVMSVSMQMDIDKLSSEKMIYIYKSSITSPILSCVDDQGNAIEKRETTGLMSIGPIDESVNSVTMKYDVMVGRAWNYVTVGGDFYEDLLVFSGENVLMTPYLDFSEIQRPEKYISSISFNLETDYDWKAVIPFQEPLSDDYSFSIEKPSWSDLNALNKSSFCFGQFEKQDVGTGGTVYVDRAIVGKIQPLSTEVLRTFSNYYTELFGELSTEAPLVLLRNSNSENAMILGGVGARGAAISADVNNADECQTLSSTLYHLYFDSKIKAPNLRYPPNSWIYSGLSSHHIIKSAANLSQEVRDMYSMEVVDEPEIDYLNYLYFSFKEPDFLVLNPTLEGNMDQVQNVYYMDIKVPVVIDLINYAISETGGRDFIAALLDMASQEKDLNIDKFLKNKCGGYYEAVQRIFSGNSILPNYKNFRLDGIYSDDEITLRLTNTDNTFSNLFSHGHGYIGYLSFPLYLLDPDVFYKDVEALGVRYSSDEIQAEVRNFSSTLHQYLMQYAMFAKLAGYDELTYDNVSQMYTSNNFEVWVEYCENVGFKDSAN